MNRTRHTGGQIIRKLQTADLLIALGKTVDDVCRVIEVTQPTYQHGGSNTGEYRPRGPGS